MTTTPLTRAEKITSIRNYATTLGHKDALLLPDQDIYPEVLNHTSVSVTAKKICVWLGIKPYNVHFTIGEEPGYRAIGRKHTITAPLTENAFLFAASVTYSCLEYYFTRQKQAFDNEYLDLASIEFGLGIIFMNLFGMSNSYKLNHLTAKQYSELFTECIDINHFDRKVVMEHLVEKARRQMPERFRDIPVSHEESYVSTHRRKKWEKAFRAVSVVILAVFIIGTSFFVWAQRPKVLSSDLMIQAEDIQTLYSSYNLCTQSANKVDTRRSDDDVFTYRHIDSELSRCRSIKNKHDYMVQEYNRQLNTKRLIN